MTARSIREWRRRGKADSGTHVDSPLQRTWSRCSLNGSNFTKAAHVSGALVNSSRAVNCNAPAVIRRSDTQTCLGSSPRCSCRGIWFLLNHLLEYLTRTFPPASAEGIARVFRQEKWSIRLTTTRRTPSGTTRSLLLRFRPGLDDHLKRDVPSRILAGHIDPPCASFLRA